MQFIVIGVNHRTAPIDVRERFSLSRQQVEHALNMLIKTQSVLECVIVSTCNRMEIYTVVDKLERESDHTYQFMQKYFQVSDDLLRSHIYRLHGSEAQSHLLRVTCGLDSMIIGETQILGQVRDCFLLAQQLNCTGVIFNTLFKSAITVAKRSHSETGIADHPVSVGYAAVELIRQMFGNFQGRHVLIIGAGKIAELTVKHLLGYGANQFSIINRTYENAKLLAEQCNGQAFPFEQLEMLMGEADIVISSTGAGSPILLRSDILRIMNKRKNRLLIMMDLAMPRDFDSLIHEMDNVFLYNLDDLQTLVDFHVNQRMQAVSKIESIIYKALQEYQQWLHLLGVTPLIRELQAKAEAIHLETMNSLQNKLPELTERELKVVRKLSKSMLTQIIRDPILKLKELSVEPEGDTYKNMFSEMFGLQNEQQEIANQKNAQTTIPGYKLLVPKTGD